MEIGKLVGLHGVRGELKLLPHNRDSDAVAEGVTVRVDRSGREFEVTSARPHKAVLLLGLRGVDTIEAAQALVGARLFVRTADLPPLPPGEFYWFEVIGLEVITEDGRSIGRVADILANPGHDVYVVRDGAHERLVPAVEEVVIAIEPAAGRIVVRPPDGLLEL